MCIQDHHGNQLPRLFEEAISNSVAAASVHLLRPVLYALRDSAPAKRATMSSFGPDPADLKAGIHQLRSAISTLHLSMHTLVVKVDMLQYSATLFAGYLPPTADPGATLPSGRGGGALQNDSAEGVQVAEETATCQS